MNGARLAPDDAAARAIERARLAGVPFLLALIGVGWLLTRVVR